MNRFFDRLKNLVSNSWLHPRHLSLSARKKSMEIFEPFVEGTILDVGCGRKPYQSVFRRVSRYIGIDVPNSMHGHQAVDIFASATNLPFRNETFDAVLCTEVLEHTKDPAATVKELVRVARSKGFVVITVPLTEPLHEEPHDYFRFTKYGLAELASSANLEVVQLKSHGGTWSSLGQRFSVFLYQTIGSRSGPNRIHIPRPLLGPPVVLICAVIQIIAAGLDLVWFDETGTMGYALLGMKSRAVNSGSYR